MRVFLITALLFNLILLTSSSVKKKEFEEHYKGTDFEYAKIKSCSG